MDNAEVKSKLDSSEIEKVNTCVKDTQNWLDQNTSASTEELDSKFKECEDQLKTVAIKMYEAGAGAQSAETKAKADVEEVD